MTKLILALGAGVLTTGAAFFLGAAFHRLIGKLFDPMVERISGAPAEGSVPAKQKRQNNLGFRKWLSIYYAVILGLLAGLAVWRSA